MFFCFIGLCYRGVGKCLTRAQSVHVRWYNQILPVQSVSGYTWLYDYAPAFHINGDNVQVLSSPSEFYETLKDNVATAKRRVTLASLYLGTGLLECHLVDAIKECLVTARQEGRHTQVRILLDHVRGSRGKCHNSRTMLLPLKKQFPDDIQIALYHNPKLRGLRRWLIPEKYNEVLGVTHLKVYLTDNTVILSGANLSEDYFVNRQDRYIVFKECPNLAEYFNELVSVVSRFSLTLQPDNTTSMGDNVTVHPYLGSERTFITEAHVAIEKFISKWSNMGIHSHHKGIVNSHGSIRNIGGNDINSQGNTRCHRSNAIESQGSRGYYGSDTINFHNENISNSREASACTVSLGSYGDTVVFPLIQMGPLGITQDEMVTCAIFDVTCTDSNTCLATGYFNLTEEYSEKIITSKGNYQVLCAHPEANGFYKARGIIGGITDAFTQFAKEFYNQVSSAGQQKRFSLKEYKRVGWTFHVKGLWLRRVGQLNPSLTMIGSPNFGHRSVKRDLENQVVLITDNMTLRRQLNEECERVYEYGVEVDNKTFSLKERTVPLWAWLVTRVTRTFF